MLTVFFPDIDLSHKHFLRQFFIQTYPKIEIELFFNYPTVMNLNKLKIKINFSVTLLLNKSLKNQIYSLLMLTKDSKF